MSEEKTRLSISDLKAQLAEISDRLKLKGVKSFTMTKDIEGEWTLVSIGIGGEMKFVHGPTGIREMTAWLNGVIWMLEQKDAGLL